MYIISVKVLATSHPVLYEEILNKAIIKVVLMKL